MLIGVVALVVAVASLLPLLSEQEIYSSSAQVRISALDSTEGVFSESEGQRRIAGDEFRELQNEIQIIRSASTRRSVHERLGGDVGSFSGPDVEQVEASEVLEITVRSPDPTVAADVANAYAEVVVAGRRERSIADLVTKASELREQIAQASAELDSAAGLADDDLSPNQTSALQVRQNTLATQILDFTRRADQLDVEIALRGRGTQIIEHAGLDLSPAQPPLVRTGVLALVLGALLGMAIAVVVDTVRDRLGEADELLLVRATAPILARVPHDAVDHDEASSRVRAAGEEAFRYLRTNLLLAAQREGVRALTVTSAVAGEGKSVTAANLARTMAQAGNRVVLIDCDLRRPTIHQRLGLDNASGLTSMIMGAAPVTDCTTFVSENLAVICSGPTVEDPTEILGHHRFDEIIRSLTLQADMVILDTPPALPVADAIITSRVTDATLLVSRVGLVRRRAIRDVLRLLDEANVRVIGFVANDVERTSEYGYYGIEQPDHARPYVEGHDGNGESGGGRGSRVGSGADPT